MNFGSIKRFGTSAAIGMAGMACWSATHKPQNNIAPEYEYNNDMDCDCINNSIDNREVMLYC